jgi:hypothetical protein
MDTTQRRPGCLIVLLGLVIARDLAGVAVTLSGVGQGVPGFPTWALWASIACGVLSVVSAVALFARRRWGFFGLCAAYAGLAAINVAFGPDRFVVVYSTIMSAFVLAIIFGMLIRGGDESAWAGMK